MPKILFRLIFRWLFRIEIQKSAHFVPPPRLLIVANHASFLDGLLLGLFLPFEASFVLHSTVAQNRFFRLFLSQIDYLTLDQGNPYALKTVIRLLEAGRPVVIFPEGRITVTGSLMKIHEGSGFIAAKTHATILPIHIGGTAHSYFSRLPRSLPHRLFPKITLTWLPTTTIQIPEHLHHTVRHKKAGDAMHHIMQSMLFQAQPTQTLFDALLCAVRLHGRSRKLVEDAQQNELRYDDLLQKSLAIGRMVSRISVPDQVIGLLLPNTSITLCVLYGLISRQRIPAMLNYTASTAGLASACTVSGITLILTSQKFLDAMPTIRDSITTWPDIQVVTLEQMKLQFCWSDKLWLLAYAQWVPLRVSVQSKPDDPAVILFTSGSEGKPKGVVHSHRSLLANVAQVRAVIDFNATDKFMLALPLFHAFGFLCGAIVPVMCGAQLFLYPSPLHYRQIPAMSYDKDCTVLFGTNTFLNHYAHYAHPYDFYRIRYVLAGAEKLREPVQQLWWEKFGIRILEGYGATECAPALALNTPMAYRSGTVGRLLPGLEFKLEPVPGLKSGSLLHVRGPNLMLGYHQHDQPGKLHPLPEGWYNTGDIVQIDAEGYISILGRIKRFAKISGEMVALETVEEVAYFASAHTTHAAISIPDTRRGESIVLYTTDNTLNRAQLHQAAQQLGYPELVIPRHIRVLPELPRLGSGKTDYVKLQENMTLRD